MQKTTQNHLNKFQQETEVYIDTQDLKSYWVISARIPKKQASLHHLHRAKKYISSPNMEGDVLLVSDPENSMNYTTENWGTMENFDDFVENALKRIRGDMEEYDQKSEQGCGTTCD